MEHNCLWGSGTHLVLCWRTPHCWARSKTFQYSQSLKWEAVPQATQWNPTGSKVWENKQVLKHWPTKISCFSKAVCHMLYKGTTVQSFNLAVSGWEAKQRD